METAIKRDKLVYKLMLIYILNIADWACTVVLLDTDLFYEANPLMRSVIADLPQGILIKCLLPALAISLIIFALRFLGMDELRLTDRFVCFAVVFYTAVNLDHVINFLLLLLT